MKKALLLVVLLALFSIPIYSNLAVTTDFRQGYFESVTPPQFAVDNTLISIAYLNLGDNSPFNIVIYFGGYPEVGTFVYQDGYWFTWKPNGQIFCLWFSSH